MPIPTPTEMLMFCVLAASVQAAVTLRFLARARRALLSPSEDAPPVPVSVIVPCKGGAPELEENLLAVIDQDYAAGAEFLFVTPSASDPVYERLKRVADSRPAAAVRVLVSGAVPERCGEKGLNMIYGVENSSPRTEALVFADSDVRVPPGWLKDLVRGLSDKGAAVTTAPALFRAGRSLAGDMGCAWTAMGIQYLDLASCVVGHSFAVSKDNFSALGVDALWSRSLSDDLALTRRVIGRGLGVRFAYRAMPTAAGAAGWTGLLNLTVKWMTLFRFYYPQVWVLGAALTAFKFFAVVLAALGRGWVPAAVLFAADAALIYVTLCSLRSLLGERFGAGTSACLARFPLTALAAAPALQLIYAANFAASVFSSRVNWGGYAYRIRSAYDVRVERAA